MSRSASAASILGSVAGVRLNLGHGALVAVGALDRRRCRGQSGNRHNVARLWVVMACGRRVDRAVHLVLLADLWVGLDRALLLVGSVVVLVSLSRVLRLHLVCRRTAVGGRGLADCHAQVSDGH